MSAIGTLVATAAFSVGVVAVAKAARRRFGRGRPLTRDRAGAEGVIDLEADENSGVWRVQDHRR
jgi:hypothetical protein